MLAYKAYMEAGGSRICRQRYQPPSEVKPLYCDLYDATRHHLLEAKGSTSREAIRMAIGQLLDYARFVKPPPQLGVLLPTRPRQDLEVLLTAQAIAIVWPIGNTNRPGFIGGSVA